MKNLNESLLESIDLIQESALDAEMGVLFAMGEEYSKASMLMEYASEDVVEQFDIIQESTLFMEAKKDKEEKDEAKTAADTKEGESTKGKGIVGFWNWIKGIFTTFFSKIGKKIVKLGKKIKEFFSSEVEGPDGQKVPKKDISALINRANETIDSKLKGNDRDSLDKNLAKNYNAIKAIYGAAKKKVFRLASSEVQVLIPFFFEGLSKEVNKIINSGSEKISLEVGKLVNLEYVKFDETEMTNRINEDKEKITKFIDENISKANEAKKVSKMKNADLFVKHLQGQASSFQSYAIAGSFAWYDLVEKVVDVVTQ